MMEALHVNARKDILVMELIVKVNKNTKQLVKFYEFERKVLCLRGNQAFFFAHIKIV